MAITIHIGELDEPDVQELLALHVAAMRSHSPPEACHVLAGESLRDLAITFFTARREGKLQGIGALKGLGGKEGEIKSMRTAPDALRLGTGAAILRAIVAEARRRGYRKVRLETGRSDDFKAANRLYERAGFTDCGPFGSYPASDFTRFMSLTL